MDHSFIIQLLKEKEASLLNELQHVRSIKQAFLRKKGEALAFYPNNPVAEMIPATYEACTTYNSKILFILKSRAVPMTADEVVLEIMMLQPALELKKLHNTISYSLSMLAKTGRVRKHAFNRHIKYSFFTA